MSNQDGGCEQRYSCTLPQDWPLNCLGQGQDCRQGNPLAKEKGQGSHQDPEESGENEFR